jgi:hypothetical protein
MSEVLPLRFRENRWLHFVSARGSHSDKFIRRFGLTAVELAMQEAVAAAKNTPRTSLASAALAPEQGSG